MSKEKREKLMGVVSVAALAVMVMTGISEREQQSWGSENAGNDYSAFANSDQFANLRDACIKAHFEQNESMQATCATGETNGGAK